jgi:hypothetical protein
MIVAGHARNCVGRREGSLSRSSCCLATLRFKQRSDTSERSRIWSTLLTMASSSGSQSSGRQSRGMQPGRAPGAKDGETAYPTLTNARKGRFPLQRRAFCRGNSAETILRRNGLGPTIGRRPLTCPVHHGSRYPAPDPEAVLMAGCAFLVNLTTTCRCKP